MIFQDVSKKKYCLIGTICLNNVIREAEFGDFLMKVYLRLGQLALFDFQFHIDRHGARQQNNQVIDARQEAQGNQARRLGSGSFRAIRHMIECNPVPAKELRAFKLDFIFKPYHAGSLA
ncbi:hypothetical protein ACFSC6_12160 [Rufibacter sediminis]|uniref:hypothetical protein n=1 Tax=Rufibacter sediminis TaxID=2762756 RepID=UPI001F5127D1|nr:hypothetical protein [Rufibacter sediminis]